MGQLEYVSMSPAVNIVFIIGGIIGGVVLLLLCVILVLILLKIVNCLCSDKQPVPLSLVSAGQDDKIEMNVNIVYQKSAVTSISGLQTDSVHLYEELSDDFREEMMAASKMKQEQAMEADHEDDYEHVSIMDNEDKIVNTATEDTASVTSGGYDHLSPKI